MRQLFLLTLVLILFTTVFSQNARGFILKKSLDEAIKKSLPGVFAYLRSLEIEDVKGNATVPSIGLVDYDVTEIKIPELGAGDFQLQINEPDFISAAVLRANFGASVKFSAKQRNFPRFGASGTATAKSKELRMKVDSIVIKKNNKIFFDVKNVDINLGNIDVKISGGGFTGWLINMMVGIFKSNIKKSLEEAIKKGLTEIVNKDLNDLIQKTPHIIPIKDKVNLNLAITEIGFKTNEYIYGAVVGAFYEEKASNEAVVSPLPDRPLNDRTGQVYVSPNMFKSAAETFVKAGILKATVNAEDVPPESPLKLNTKSLSNYIPELYSKWPDHDLQVKVEVKQVPTFEVSADGLFANLHSSFEMNVKTQDGFVKAFNADFTFNGGALLSMKEAGGRVYNLTGEVKKVVIGLKLKESFMGNVSLTRMEQFLNIVIVRGMIAAANRQLKEGYSLILPEVPDGFLIKNILVEYRPEFIAVSANAIFEENLVMLLDLFLEPKSIDVSYLFKKVLSKFEFDYESAMNQVLESLNKKDL